MDVLVNWLADAGIQSNSLEQVGSSLGSAADCRDSLTCLTVISKSNVTLEA
jgi:hypothetical protein